MTFPSIAMHRDAGIPQRTQSMGTTKGGKICELGVILRLQLMIKFWDILEKFSVKKKWRENLQFYLLKALIFPLSMVIPG